jgi:hypothetical protein
MRVATIAGLTTGFAPGLAGFSTFLSLFDRDLFFQGLLRSIRRPRASRGRDSRYEDERARRLGATSSGVGSSL